MRDEMGAAVPVRENEEGVTTLLSPRDDAEDRPAEKRIRGMHG